MHSTKQFFKVPINALIGEFKQYLFNNYLLKQLSSVNLKSFTMNKFFTTKNRYRIDIG